MSNNIVISTDIIIEQLLDARKIELELLSDLSDEQMFGPKMHFVEPPIWEMGHVGWFQEYWILRNLYKENPLLRNSDSIYDSFNVSYKLRWDHLYPSKKESLDFITKVLEKTTNRIEEREPTKEEAYFYQLVALHEDMHSENLTLIRQTHGYPIPHLSIQKITTPPEIDYSFKSHDVYIPGGTFMLGALQDEPFVFDNAKWAHPVTVNPFQISATPVTNIEFISFVEDEGYQNRNFWRKDGWDWRRREKADHPVFWHKDSDGKWYWRRFGRMVPLEPYHPVCHVNWHEAVAYCRWAGRRLPTEAEWEMAASCEPTPDGRGITSRKRRFPWGDEPPTPDRANLDYQRLGTIDVRALAAGDSALGCRQMIGNVWEWVEDTFQPYPGFIADPYKEYSQPYFGIKKVLRGGCWTTRSRLIRNTWRNFYMKQRRNIFSGFRTVAL